MSNPNMQSYKALTVRSGGIASMILGGAVILTGIALDFHEDKPLQSTPFLLNVLTAIGGALVGIPIALFVLQRIARHEAERAQWKSTLNMTRAAFADFYTLLSMGPSSTGSSARTYYRELHLTVHYCIERVENLLTPLEKLFKEGFADLAAFGQYEKGAYKPYGPLKREILYLASELEEIGTKYPSWLPSDDGLALLRPHIEASWRFIDSFIRPRVIESGRPWISIETAVFIPTFLDTKVSGGAWSRNFQSLAREFRIYAETGKISSIVGEFADSMNELHQWRGKLAVLEEASKHLSALEEYPLSLT